jgi:hypothetical protein
MKWLTPARAKTGLLAALLFWVPNVIVHAIRANDFSSRDVRVLTFLLPSIAFLGLWIASRVNTSVATSGPELLSAVLGIWILAPMLITLGWTFAGGGFSSAWGSVGVAIGTVLFPIFTFMMSVRDGTLAALGFVTLGLLLRASAKGVRVPQ